MITIREIAEMTGVSPTTVQNVIHGRTSKVSRENLERIQKVLKEKHYVPRLAQETLTKGRTKIVGVVIWTMRHFEENVVSDPFYGQIIGYLEDEIRRAGYYMMLYIHSDIEEIFRTAASWNMIGVSALSFTSENLGKLRTLMGDCPVVGIDTARNRGPVPCKVGLDDEDGGFRMTQYLLGRGYEHILFASESARYTENLRLKGYRQALENVGLPFRDRYVLELDRADSVRNRECLTFISSFAGKNAAVFCASDLMAVKVIYYLHKRGIRIPEEIGVAGFDDNIYARTMWPTLTTVHQSVKMKAEEAMKMLLAQVQRDNTGNENPDRGTLLKGRVIARDSTR